MGLIFWGSTGCSHSVLLGRFISLFLELPVVNGFPAASLNGTSSALFMVSLLLLFVRLLVVCLRGKESRISANPLEQWQNVRLSSVGESRLLGLLSFLPIYSSACTCS